MNLRGCCISPDHGFPQHLPKFYRIIIRLHPFPQGQLQVFFDEGEVNARDGVHLLAKLFLGGEITGW